MRFLLDENVSARTAAFLCGLGIDARHASEAGLKGAPDEAIYEHCKRERFVLITFDHEFGYAYHARKDLEGLILLRLHPQTLEIVHTALTGFFAQVSRGDLEVRGRITVLERGRIRSRSVQQLPEE